MKKTHKVNYIVGIIAIFLAIIISLQNSEVVIVNFLFWKFQISRIILIVLMLLVGFVLGYIFHGMKRK